MASQRYWEVRVKSAFDFCNSCFYLSQSIGRTLRPHRGAQQNRLVSGLFDHISCSGRVSGRVKPDIKDGPV
eukprot:3598553-Amphidinium_carterae.1